ncbi:hypothetical protein P3T76_009859 [Phytophthora citrophthora]|uniref:Uncharacterized protein n=1 Tax=Phytophthora citrophthora TaxID=4793 RepID=A0AAD9GF48_9STRA|nr:hypothetical protein P3T76_009859 [Phytophthora citrophthora]
MAKYAFELEPVSVERIDVLESKLRDLQDKLNHQQEELERLSKDISAVRVLPFGRLGASHKNAHARKL